MDRPWEREGEAETGQGEGCSDEELQEVRVKRALKNGEAAGTQHDAEIDEGIDEGPCGSRAR